MGLRSSRISVTSSFLVYIVLCLLLLPLRWLTAWIFAAVIHEIGHIIAIYLCGCSVRVISIKADGAVIETGVLSAKQECLCAAAGPVASFLLMLSIVRFPLLGFCAAIQLLVNIFPMYPLDGGRIVRCVINDHFSEKRRNIILKSLQGLAYAAILSCGFIMTFSFHLGLFPLLFCMAFAVRNWTRNIPCKQRGLIVQ